MQIKRIFPEIIVERKGGKWEAGGGLRLASMLKGDLLLDQEVWDKNILSRSKRLDPAIQHRSRINLLQALSAWLSNVTLELRLIALPNLYHRSDGRLLVSLLMRAFSSEKEHCREMIASRYLSLVPILYAFFPELEFVPVTDGPALIDRVAPFDPTHAVSIRRLEKSVSLSVPLKRLSLGFGPMEERAGEFNNVVKHCFPWVPSPEDGTGLYSILMGALHPVQIIIRLKSSKPCPSVLKRLHTTISTCERFLAHVNSHQLTLKNQAEAVRRISLEQLVGSDGPSFGVGVFILSPGPVDASLCDVLGNTLTWSPGVQSEEDLFRGGYRIKPVSTAKAVDGRYIPEKYPFALAEAAAAFKLPMPTLEDVIGIPIKRSRSAPAAVYGGPVAGNNSVELFTNVHRGIDRPIFLCPDDRMRHAAVFGQTGTGKSTLLEYMILQDICNGCGLAVIDPHGEMIDSIVGKIPDHRVNDVILFDPLDRERPPGLNLLEWKTIDERDLIIDELYLTLDRIYDMKQTGGPIFESNFRGMMKLLTGDRPREDFVPTLLDFTTCYLSRKFRNWLMQSIDDLHVKDFKYELERTGGDASLSNLAPYITSKFSRFVSDSMLRRIIGQTKSSINFDEVLNTGKILLIKLGKGRFGANVSALISNQIVAHLKLAAMKRGEMPPKERRDFYLYVDEAHNLPSENFMELLSEARKFRMGLVLATQYTSQLTQSLTSRDNLLAAILGNVGTLITFRLGQEDAEKLAPALQPEFKALDITGLPNWHGYTRMQISRQATPPFSFCTVKNETPYDEQKASKVKTLSRLKYGNDCHLVDAEILRKRNVWKEASSNS